MTPFVAGAIAAGLVGVLALSGCSGGDGPSPATLAPVTTTPSPDVGSGGSADIGAPSEGSSPGMTPSTAVPPSGSTTLDSAPSGEDSADDASTTPATTGNTAASTTLSAATSTTTITPADGPPSDFYSDIPTVAHKTNLSTALAITTSGADTPPAQAAADAYTTMWQLADKAFRHPEKDWSNQIHAIALEPMATGILESINQENEGGNHNIGHSHITMTPTSVADDEVKFRACVDTTGVDVVNTHGVSMAGPNGPGDYARYIQTATFVLIDDVWKAKASDAHWGEQC